MLGTQTMLEAARQVGVARFHHVSTCEVYGDLPLDTDEVFTEDSPYRPRTPYNASKAGADHAVRAYAETYGLPVTITNCANNYGPYQFPEKLIPHFCALALDDEPLTLYASTENRREWLHVRDHCTAIDAVLVRGRVGETYHVGSGVEASITEVADRILAALDKSPSLKTIVPDRPGHDRRYVLDSSKLRTRTGLGPVHRMGAGPGGHRGVVRLAPRLVGTAAGPGADRRRRLGNRRRLTGANPRHGGRRPVGSRPARRPGGKGAVRRSPVRAARAGGAA